LPSEPAWIEPAVEHLVRNAVRCGACAETRSTKLSLALHEALCNSVIHGNLEVTSDLKERADDAFAQTLAQRAADPRYTSRLVEVLTEYDGERCRWVFTDQGKGFDVDRVMGRLVAEPEVVLASGRGILMMRAFLDDVRYELGGRRVILTLGKVAGEDQRRQHRRLVQEQVRVTPVAGDGTADWQGSYEAVARNLSPEGIALLQSRLAITDRVLVGIPAQGQTLYVLAEVRHWRTVADNVVELGCCFRPADSAAEAEGSDTAAQKLAAAMEVIIGRHTKQVPAENERRLHSRVAYTARIGIQDPSGGEVTHGFARDLSQGGMAFISTAPPGSTTKVLALPQGEGGEAVYVRARVARCTKIMGGFYDVGVQFLSLAPGPNGVVSG
jgi:anti-sigma regulatory factor (Ser/Thr protein kinase)